MKRPWWKNAIIYQVYIRSFYDSNHDGIGDIKGIIQKLDYFTTLGIDALWISPHYQSPNDDNGYDVSDFYQVNSDYGDIEDITLLINEAHKKGIKILFDLILNHTSDEHPWFVAAKDKNHPNHEQYHDYYIWHKPKFDDQGHRTRPTKWRSWFGGPVWTYNESTNEYYLHIFSKKMPDLNWRNKAMKEDIKAMANWWIDHGVDGFRVDAANHLEKNWLFEDAYPGYEQFSSLPKHHEYIKEMSTDVFEKRDIVTIGEAGGATKEEALQYCGYDSHEFNMLIHFGHTWVDIDEENQITPGKWAKGTIDVAKIKQSFHRWYDMLNQQGWNLIYWHNHDHPRIVSHYGNDKAYQKESAKMLAYTLYFMPGTPIVYQGEEIGMTNVDYNKLSDFSDVEVFTEYDNFIALGATHEQAMKALKDRSRDNARTPFQWSGEQYAGFSDVDPWMPVIGNYQMINLENQQNDQDSIFHTYQKIFQLRKDDSLAFGTITFYYLDDEQLYVYKNETDKVSYFVIANFSNHEAFVSIDEDLSNYHLLCQNYHDSSVTKKMSLRPYETVVLRKDLAL